LPLKPLKIGEVASATGLPTSTLRFYEKQGLLPQGQRSQSGYRLYDQSAVEQIRLIQVAQALGFSLSEIKQLPRNNQQLDHTLVMEKIRHKQQQLLDNIAGLQQQHSQLQHLRELLSDTWQSGKCLEPELLEGLLQTNKARHTLP